MIDANRLDRIFEVFAPSIVVMNGLSLQEGSAQLGAGIRNHGNLTIHESIISDNTGTIPAGGSGTSAGCGIFNETGILTITGVEVAANSAVSGAGIHNFATASLVATDSNLHDNLSTGDGACLWINTASTAELSDVTIHHNQAGRDNGGATQTHALLSGSPGINTADDCSDTDGAPVLEDHRAISWPQPSGGICDIGSFELELSGGINPITLTPGYTPTPGDTPTPTETGKEPTVRGVKKANCRHGPGLVYNESGYLLEGETAEAFARSRDSTWLWIANIHHSGYCWVSASVLAYDFDLSILEICQAPPTPTYTPASTAAEKPPSDEKPEAKQPDETVTTAPPCQSYQKQETCLKAGCQWDQKGQSYQP